MYDISQRPDIEEGLGEEDDYGELMNEDPADEAQLEAEMENLR